MAGDDPRAAALPASDPGSEPASVACKIVGGNSHHSIGMTKTTVTWRLRFRRFHWVWLPENPMDRVSEFYTTLDLCDWCAGDVFLFAQGLPPRAKQATPEPSKQRGRRTVEGGS